MTRSHKLHAALLSGALALGMAWAGASTARAQDQNGQQAAAQDQAGRRGRGQGQGRGQGGPGGGFARNPAQAVEQYQTQVNELNLTGDQKTKLDAIFKEQSEKAKTLASEVENLQGRERAEKTMGFNREMREKVNGVLTEEQRTTLRKNAASRQAKQMTERYHRATADLNLSDDQKSKIDAILADTEKKIVEASAQASADGGVAAPGGQGGARGGPFGEIQRDTREKVAGVLNADQKTKFEEAMQRRGGGQGGQGGQGGGRRRGQGQQQQQQ
jgi:hypothetical protein